MLAAARAVLDAEPRLQLDYLELRDTELGRRPRSEPPACWSPPGPARTRLLDNVAVSLVEESRLTCSAPC